MEMEKFLNYTGPFYFRRRVAEFDMLERRKTNIYQLP